MPFAFAKRFGVCVIAASGERGQAVAACKSQPTLATLAEIKRFIGRPVQIRLVAETEFEELLTNTYARDASEAKQMVEDMGDELDLASLADSVPETEDLLEQEDDAPIIRLVTKMIGAAVQAGLRLALQGDADQFARLDGDGQHDPADLPKLIARCVSDPDCDFALGSRNLGEGSFKTSWPRRLV